MRLPQIAVFTRVAPYAGGIHLFSDGTGYFHADYFSGWEAAQLQKVLDECENDSMQSAPDAWCEDHVTFRDAPKAEDVEDEELREKLEPFQPPPFDATRILSEAVDGCVEINQCVGCTPDNSSLIHFSAMTWLCRLRRAVRNRHRHAIEQARVDGVEDDAMIQHERTVKF